MVSRSEDTDKNRIMQVLCDFFAKEKGGKKSFASDTTCETCCLEGKLKKIKSSQRIGRLIIVQREEKGDKDNSWVVVTLSNYFSLFFKLHSS